MKRRSFLAAASLFIRPQFATAETLAVSYRLPPPYFSDLGLLDPGPDLMPSPPVLPPHPKPWFSDITGSVLDCDPLRKGIPYWVARLDPATGIDLYGNNGIAVADIDQDGHDEIYVCQPGGLPNRLFRWDGSKLIDISAAAGLDILDDSTSALFLDLRNIGRQDLVLMRGSGPLLFLNDGTGRFTYTPNAFQFATVAAGAFTGMAAADYDRDGRLDLYCCCYSFFQSEAQYRYPVPYHDARNGPPNFLFRNRLNPDGTGFFEDVTAISGMNQNNNRFSFAPAWCDYNQSGWPSLYVANDFGQNNLYKNEGGKFSDVAEAAGVADIGPGMSAAWFDENGDGAADLYVANMWSPSGQRLLNAAALKNATTASLKEAYRRHAKGNSFYRNSGNGSFVEVGAQLGIEMGRWAWSSDAHDFDNDGQPEIYITCGMLTGDKQPDLMSYFWRQVVAASPATEERSAAYEHGWNSINQFIREGYSWNGNEANVFYKKDGARYRDASHESGLNVAADSRAFAVADLTGDGSLDLLLKSRLGPQLRAYQNNIGSAQQRIAFQLEGTKSNRDAIGSRLNAGKQTKWLSAGSGYLSQNTKTIYFGLGAKPLLETLKVTWPSGAVQQFENLEAGFVYRLTEGKGITRQKPFASHKPLPNSPLLGQNKPLLEDTWFVDPIPLPTRHKGPGLLILHGKEKPREAAILVDLTANPDHAAAYSLFRRYLFEYRAPLDLPLAFLIDAEGRALKVYQKLPSASQVAKDLKQPGNAHPYAGQRIGLAHRDFFKLGAALLSCGYPDQALPYLEAVLDRDTTNTRTLVLLGQIHREANRIPEARRYINRALQLSPDSPEAWNEMGGVHQALAEDEPALSCFERAIAIQKDLAYATLNAAQVLLKLDRFPQAAIYFSRVIAIDAKSADAFNGLGLAQARQKQGPAAETSFRQALALQPNLGSAWNNLAVLLISTGRTPEAATTLGEGIRLAPKEELLYLNLGRLHIGRGDRAAAARVMRDLLKVLPDSQVAQKALAELQQ